MQHVDTGELLMQAFADRAAVSETLQTGLATFYSRSRKVLHQRLLDSFLHACLRSVRLPPSTAAAVRC